MILKGDARHLPLADETVQCVVTSPPYWGLRDYQLGDKGIGLEPTREAYIAVMVEVFREVWRVLKPDGTVWLNLGDSFASNPAKGGSDTYNGRNGLKPKDLCMIPARVALALQADGWWLRSDIVWAKNNPMPEPVTDRPTKSHEYVFLLSKSADYFYDADAIREAPSSNSHGGGHRNWTADGFHRNGIGSKTFCRPSLSGRNRRDVWTINSEPTPEAHFATFPQALVLPCIFAGTSARGECVKCGKNWERIIERSNLHSGRCSPNDGLHYRLPKALSAIGDPRIKARGEGWKPNHAYDLDTKGWRPTCTCNAPTRPNLVLDPFGGSSTVGIVAERLGRRWATVELSAAYIEIAKRRTAQRGLFSSIQAQSLEG